MKPLTRAQAQELSELAIPGYPEMGDDHRVVCLELLELGLATRRFEDCPDNGDDEWELWDATERGLLALRIHVVWMSYQGSHVRS